MRTSESGRARLVYVLGQFPSGSETFILREMTTLEEMGFQLLPLSLSAAAETPAHPGAEALASRTLYRPAPLSSASLAAFFRTAIQRPFGLSAALLVVMRHIVARPANARELLVSLLAATYFASKLHARDVRHVHAHFASRPATVAWLLAEICGSGYSISCHAQDIFGSGTILLSSKLREADFVTVCTRYGMERLLRNHSLTLSDKLHLIYHGVDVGRMARQTHVDYPVPLLLSVGRLVEKKGFQFLLQAVALLNGQGLPFELVIVGDGPLRDELERLASGLGLRDKVVFAGFLPQDQLSHVYRRADVFALASIVAKDGDRDGLPNVILEAMAFGVPVVASNLSGIPEAVIHEQTGLLVPPGAPQELAAAIERALNDTELRERLVHNARREMYAQFDLQRNTVRLGGLFAEMLGLRDWPGRVALEEPEAAEG